MSLTVLALIVIILNYCWSNPLDVDEWSLDDLNRSPEHAFDAFVRKYRRADHLTDSLKLVRFENFKATIERINQYNKSHANFSISSTADMSAQEIREMRCGSGRLVSNWRETNKSLDRIWDGTYCSACNRFPELNNETLPREWDWSAKGAVTSVNTQGGCGGCWGINILLKMFALHIQ